MDTGDTSSSFRHLRRHSCPAGRLPSFNLRQHGGIKVDLGQESKTGIRRSSIYNHVKEPMVKQISENTVRHITSTNARSQSIYDDCIDLVTKENRDRNGRHVTFLPHRKDSVQVTDSFAVGYKKRHSAPTIPVFEQRSGPADGEPDTQHEALKQCRLGPRLSVPGLASRPNKTGQKDHHGPNRKNDSADRELHYLFQNNVAERKLTSQMKELEKQHNAGLAEHRYQRQKLYDQYRTTLHRTPTTDEWLNKRMSRINILKEQERDEIVKRQNTFIYNNRPPLHLRDTVARVKSAGYFGTSNSIDKINEVSMNTIIESNTHTPNKAPSRATMRRHTIAINAASTELPSAEGRQGREDSEEPETKSIEKSVIPSMRNSVKLKQILDFWQTSEDHDGDGETEETASELSEEEVIFAVQMLV